MRNKGEVLNSRYRIEGVIGQGGMGAVYLATHLELDVQVAIKEMLQGGEPETREVREMQFRTEARILNRLRHQFLPRVYDFFELDGRHYLVMDFIKGGTLDDVQRKGRLTEQQVLGWARELSEVLAYLHSNDPPVIFRDLKPANIMLAEDNTIRLIDFGIAKVFEEGRGAQTKTVLQGAASHGFSAPEQYGLGGTDARSDIYGLGATLYTLLTDTVPPPSMEIAAGISELVPLRVLRRGISDKTISAIEWMMQVKREMRPADMAAVQEALGFVDAAASGAAPSLPLQMRRVLREEFQAFFPTPTWVERSGVLSDVVARLLAPARRQPMFAVVGEPGLGKSRLLQEVEASARGQFEVLPIAHGTPSIQDQPYGLLLPALAAWMRRHSADVLPVLEQSISLQDLFDASDVLPELKPLLRGYTTPASRDGMERTRSVAAVLTSILEVAARTRPALLLLDDMQWADDDTVRFLDSLRVGSQAPSVAVFLSIDSDGSEHRCKTFMNRWARRGELQVVSLPPLSKEDMAPYVQALLPPIEGLSRQMDVLHECSHGNPLLLEEILRFLVVRRYIAEQNGILVLSEFRGDNLPRSLDEAVRRRREHLPLETQTLLGVTSVAGVRFDLRSALKLTGESTTALAEALARACETLFVRPDERGVYRFTSQAARDVFYQGLDSERRSALHRKMAAMEEERAARTGTAAHTTYHYRMAGDIDRRREAGPGGDGMGPSTLEVLVGDAHQVKLFMSAPPPTPADVDDALDAIGMLLKGARSLSVYWNSGQLAHTSFGTGLAAITRLVAEYRVLCYSQAGDAWFVNGVAVAAQRIPQELKGVLGQHRISGFEFQGPLDAQAMKEFLGLVCETRDAIQAAGGWSRALSARRVRHVVINELVYVAVAERDVFDPARLKLATEVVVRLAGSGATVSPEHVDWDLERIDDMLTAALARGANDAVLAQLGHLRGMLGALRHEAGPAPADKTAEAPEDVELRAAVRDLLSHSSREDIKRLLSLSNAVELPLQHYLDTHSELMVQHLEDSDVQVRTLAAMGLLQMGQDVRRRLLHYLRTSDHAVGRATAVFILVRTEVNASEVLAEEVLRCTNTAGTLRLLSAMQMGRLDWTSPLSNLLQSSTTEMRQAAFDLLVQADLTASEKLALLLEPLESEALEVVEDAVRAVGEVGDEQAVPTLAHLMERLFSRKTTECVRVQEQVCLSLGCIGSVAALPLLKAVLIRKGFLIGAWGSSVRAAAVRALGHLPGAAARDVLQKMVNDTDANVSRTARGVLSGTRDESAVVPRDALLNLIREQGAAALSP